jgi:hypothetical protein
MQGAGIPGDRIPISCVHPSNPQFQTLLPDSHQCQWTLAFGGSGSGPDRWPWIQPYTIPLGLPPFR